MPTAAVTAVPTNTAAAPTAPGPLRSPRRPGARLVGLGLLLAAGLSAACEDITGGGDAVLSEPFQLQRDATDRTGFQLTGVNGEIVITGVEADETFRASGFRRVENCALSEAEEWIDRLEVRISETADDIVVRTIQPLDTSPCTLTVDYELSVPARLLGRVVAVNGDIEIRDLRAGVSVTSVNGVIALDEVAAPITARLTNGAIEVDATLADDESIDLLAVNGSIDLAVPTTTGASLTASVVNGTIRVVNLTLSDAVRTGTSLTGTLGTGTGAIVARTTNGDITVAGS
jgi:hypothetical protein